MDGVGVWYDSLVKFRRMGRCADIMKLRRIDTFRGDVNEVLTSRSLAFLNFLLSLSVLLLKLSSTRNPSLRYTSTGTFSLLACKKKNSTQATVREVNLRKDSIQQRPLSRRP